MALKLGTNLDLSKVVKSLGNKERLVPYIDLEIGKGEFEWNFQFKPKVGDDAWHPSGDCTPSLHQLWQKASGEAEERHLPTSLYKTFMVGNFWHAYLQWIVEKRLGFCGPEAIERRGHKWWGDPIPPKSDMTLNQNGRPRWDDRGATMPGYYRKEDAYYLRYPEQQIRDETGKFVGENQDFMETAKHWPQALPNGAGGYMAIVHPKPYHWATGAGDIAPCSIPSHGDYAIDFKTMNARMFATGPSPDYLEKWECQGNIYMDFFDMDQIIFLGICKDSPHDMKEWVFTRNQPLIDAIYLKWSIVSECLDEGIEPPEDEVIDLPLQGTTA